MMDTPALVAVAVCLAGLSLALAGVSYYTWLAQTRGTDGVTPFRSAPFLWGALLTAAGWAVLQRDHRWESALALVVAASFLWDLVALARARRGRPPGAG